MKLSDYILLSKDKRTKHVDLTTECSFEYYYQDKRPLLNELGVVDDVESWVNAKIQRCHLCEFGRHRGECSNPKHQYIGTTSENFHDVDPAIRKRIQQAAVEARSVPIVLRNKDSGEIYEFASQGKAAKALGLAQSALSRVLNGHRKSHKGFEVYHA